ncbi:MAG: SPFH domain-containing protein, partial [Erysipelotrichaceae bacterium]
MGLIKAAFNSLSGSLADQWLEAIQPADMGVQTLMTYGTAVRANDSRYGNKKGTADIISNGSKIQVYDNQLMMIIDGGKVVDYTAEPGYYTVDTSSAPSLLNGEFKDTLSNAWERIKFGGTTPQTQKVYYINLQEVKGIKFGTKNPVSYYDTELDADLYIRAHGSYSIRVSNPILFYQEVMPRNLDQVEVSDVNEQFLNEFISGLQSSINQMSADGISVRRVASQSTTLSKYMATALDEDWRLTRGFEIQAVGMEVSYDEETKELFKLRSQGAMLKDASVREGYVQGSIARGMEAAGSNANGA